MRRPGLFIALVFAVGLVLGLGASSFFLDVDAGDLETAVGSRLADQSGPLGGVLLDRLEESDAVDGIASDVREQQVRNLAVAGAIGLAGAAALGRACSGWTIRRPVGV